jgi:imidazolonepropionase-like amidohydrolase
MNNINLLFQWVLIFAFFSCQTEKSKREDQRSSINLINKIWPINEDELPIGNNIKAVVGATLINGRGGEAIANSSVVIDGNKIVAVGISGEVKIPEEAEIVNAKGLTLIPGLIDAHFHLDRSVQLPNRFLKNGITSLRDPGAWIEAYEGERNEGYPLPRLFLTGPHFDMFPPAYPHDAFIVRDEEEARMQVNRLADQGASAIKVYFRLPLGLIKVICEEAHKRGLVVTGHLEITNAIDAINAGLDGIEHVTSLGTSLIPAREAEKYRQAVLLDNNARRSGRYEMWSGLDMEGAEIDSLLGFLAEKQTFLTATLAVYEFQDQKADSIKFTGFKNMMAFIGKAKKAGVSVVVGSHSVVPFADEGWAYHREMELLVESGWTNQEAIVAATMDNARFFKIEDRLGSIEPGKQADLVLLSANPLENIRHMRKIEKVMLNGSWIKRQ